MGYENHITKAWKPDAADYASYALFAALNVPNDLKKERTHQALVNFSRVSGAMPIFSTHFMLNEAWNNVNNCAVSVDSLTRVRTYLRMLDAADNAKQENTYAPFRALVLTKLNEALKTFTPDTDNFEKHIIVARKLYDSRQEKSEDSIKVRAMILQKTAEAILATPDDDGLKEQAQSLIAILKGDGLYKDESRTLRLRKRQPDSGGTPTPT